MPSKRAQQQFTLEVPLELSQIDADAETQELRVAARAQDGSLSSETVRAKPGGGASVTLSFPEPPGPLQLLVGPASASESDLVNRQTISVDVPGQRWGEDPKLSIDPIVIPPYWWWWWLEWCRDFVIRGQVICADGSPVPGATVCAYDLDWWFWWTSTQQLGCATTALDGTFEIDFTWCCGFWPFWWWRERVWEIDPDLIARVGAVLEQDPRIVLGQIGTQPSLSAFSELLGPAAATSGPLAPADAGALEQLRAPLLAKLPGSAELGALRIWPWAPWGPWWDCDVDLIFKVTQDCAAPGTVVLQEGIDQVRFGIGQSTRVTLLANELACCRRSCPTQPCIEGECIDIAEVCGAPINDVGGNPGAPSAPVGYLYPGAVAPGAASANGDRAFAGTVDIANANIMTGVDYYEVQYFDGSDWVDLPPGGAEDFFREWLEPVPAPAVWPSGAVPFQFTSRVVSGSSPTATVTVVESREHYEASPGLPGDAFWTSNQFLVVPIDSSKFPDGAYQFRVVGWRDAGGGEVAGPPEIPGGTYTPVGGEVLPVCGDTTETNGWVLAFNNRVEPNPAAIKPCGSGSTHLCVTEPNTEIVSVKVDGQAVSVCGTVDAASEQLEVEFLAQDLSGNLGFYSLVAVYGDSLEVDLLALPGSTLTLLSGDHVGPYYGQALAQGATAPVWEGGTMLLSVNAAEAFPEPCCYDLELQAWSRTVVSCDTDFAYANRSDFTIGVGVCPPPPLRELPVLGAGEAQAELRAATHELRATTP
jgi:hypothetical protein